MPAVSSTLDHRSCVFNVKFVIPYLSKPIDRALLKTTLAGFLGR